MSLLVVLFISFFINNNAVFAYEPYGFSSYGATASNAILSITSVKELNEISKVVKAQIKNLKSGSLRENLYIPEITLSLPGGTDFGSAGMVMDQQLKVVVKNDNQFGQVLGRKDVDYAVYLYETTKNKNKKLFEAATGTVNIFEGYGEFFVNIEGGQPFDGKNMEKTYRAMVVIDSSKVIKESDEKDNSVWSDEWHITYYKG